MRKPKYFFQFVLWTVGTGLFITSCTRPVQVATPQLEKQLIVNCLFNPDSSWKVYVGKMKALSDSGGIPYVADASVRIYKKGQPLTLNYQRNGYYVAIGKKPVEGAQYKLEVTVPGYPKVTANGYIPPKATVTSIEFDTTSTYFVPDNGFDNVKVNKLQLGLRLPNRSEQYYELLGSKYNIDSYCDFIITKDVLTQLRNYKAPDVMAHGAIPSEYIDRLKYFLNVPITGKQHFLNMVYRQTGTHFWNFLVYEFSEKIRHSPPVYNRSLFRSAELFSKDLHFYNITGDSHGVFGEYPTGAPGLKDSVTLFMADLSYTGNAQNGEELTEQNEGWLTVYSLSKAMYKYQTSYINQMVNEQNPFAQPVEIYSNIHNGTGIFAGYQTEKVKLH